LKRARTASKDFALFNRPRSECDRGCQMPLQTELVDWLIRVEAEYREMPGMELTERRMQRLWGLDGENQRGIDTASTSARAAAALSVNISSRKESFIPKDTNHCEAGGLRDPPPALHPRSRLIGLAWVSPEFRCPMAFPSAPT
jgi:hypothetical protein